MERKELILKQEKVLDFLINHAKEKGFPPTLREIGAHFGLTGPKAPQKTLNILERKGYLKRVPGVSRGVEILGGSPLIPNLAGLRILMNSNHFVKKTQR